MAFWFFPGRKFGIRPILLGAISLALGSGETFACKPSSHGQWYHDCEKIIQSVELPARFGPNPAKVALIWDGKVMRLVAGMLRDDYSRVFTDFPPSIMILNGFDYVLDDLFFNEARPPILQIGASKIQFVWQGKAQWRVSAEAAETILQELRRGSQLEFEYSGGPRGQKLRFSGSGFPAAARALFLGE